MIEQLASFLARSRRLLVITGAGCSTASGIGDYRDETGNWKRAAPVQHQDFLASRAWRARYWARSQVGYPEFLRARPNPAHRALAALEARGDLVGLITQNVDGLHQRAGHENVIDLHGQLDRVVCVDCGAVVERAALQDRLEQLNPQVQDLDFTTAPDGDADLSSFDYAGVTVPECDACGRGILKPDVVFYGDSVAKDVVQRAYGWVDAADALLVVGSSLMVYSSFRFVRRAHERSVPICAVNRGHTRADEWLAFKVEGDCGDILAAAVASL